MNRNDEGELLLKIFNQIDTNLTLKSNSLELVLVHD